MNLDTHMADGERRKPINIEVCRSKVKVTLPIHMFATRLSHLWCITDFLNRYSFGDIVGKKYYLTAFVSHMQETQMFFYPGVFHLLTIGTPSSFICWSMTGYKFLNQTVFVNKKFFLQANHSQFLLTLFPNSPDFCPNISCFLSHVY